jgi:chromosome segregation ATPase
VLVISSSHLIERVTIELKELQEQFSTYRREKDANESSYMKSLESSRRDATSCRIDLANAQAEVKSLSERYKLLHDNTTLQKSELEHLRGKNAEFSASITKHQESLREARVTLQGLEEQLRQVRAEAANSRAELTLARRGEERLLAENTELQQNKQRQDKLLTSLQILQTTFEQKDVEARKQLVKEKEEMRIEWITLKKVVDEERRSFMDMERLRVTQTEDARTRYEVLEKKYHDAREESIRLGVGHEHATGRVKELEHSLRTLQVCHLFPLFSLFCCHDNLSKVVLII